MAAPAPWRTALLWRRMVLWQITSYRTAVDLELETRHVVALLRLRYGRGWRRRAPGDVVWDVADGCRGRGGVCEGGEVGPFSRGELASVSDVAVSELSAITSAPHPEAAPEIHNTVTGNVSGHVVQAGISVS
ncbi:MAG TPA: hypothetical protein VFX16_12225 [Pseudonocardiaceae bacterium]|nr:hypothetical protein [Pseudonocardiaceae bacterium]